MTIEEYIPAKILRPYIRGYRIIESSSEITNRVVPDTSFVMAFRLAGTTSYDNDGVKSNLPSATFSGLRHSVRLINYVAGSSTLVVLFRETGLPGFFRQSLHELFNETVSLDSLFPASEIAFVEEGLSEARGNRAKIEAVERYLVTRLLSTDPDPLISTAIARIYANNGQIKIRQLCDSLYISLDAFEKRFRKKTGSTAKQFSSIVKMKNLLRMHESTDSLTDLALNAGYYDQAHFNKEFKHFTGQTPSDFFRSNAYW